MHETTENPNFEKPYINKLANGLVDMYEPKLQSATVAVNDLVRSQTVIIETIQQENEKYQDAPNLEPMIEDIKTYHNKLVSIKKQMIFLREKSQNLIQRAQKLQKQKEKELESKKSQKLLAKEQEDLITVKPPMK